jgi:NADPH:quinone reductase-like Zn-dependent oxidoreductase
MFTRPLFDTPDVMQQHALLERIAALVDTGTVKTTVGEHFGTISAANLRKAHTLIESGRARGKIVLEGFAP